ncbi:MAG: hypothetical protein N4A31_01975 [Rickettsiales bacterium]|jgi:hypothetical protein|nr:hypothetical protein [Rickettsiales bacterium]
MKEMPNKRLKTMHQRDLEIESRIRDRDMDIFSAIATNRVDIVQNRIEEGVSVNAASDEYLGVTPLEMACQYYRLGIINLLISNGARVNIDTIKEMLNNRYNYKSIELLKTFKLMLDNGIGITLFIECFSLGSHPIPTSYIELVSLLRSFDPNLFNIFPLSSDEEFVHLVEFYEEEASNSFIEYYRIHMINDVEEQGYLVVENSNIFDVISREIIYTDSISLRTDFINYMYLIRDVRSQDNIYIDGFEEYLDSMILFAIQYSIDTSIIQDLANFFSINIYLYRNIGESPILFESSSSNTEIRLFAAGENYYSLELPEVNILMEDMSIGDSNHTYHTGGNEDASPTSFVGEVTEHYSL